MRRLRCISDDSKTTRQSDCWSLTQKKEEWGFPAVDPTLTHFFVRWNVYCFFFSFKEVTGVGIYKRNKGAATLVSYSGVVSARRRRRQNQCRHQPWQKEKTRGPVTLPMKNL